MNVAKKNRWRKGEMFGRDMECRRKRLHSRRGFDGNGEERYIKNEGRMFPARSIETVCETVRRGKIFASTIGLRFS